MTFYYNEDHASYQSLGPDTDTIIRESWKDSEGETENGRTPTGTFTSIHNEMWWTCEQSGLQCGWNLSKISVILAVC